MVFKTATGAGRKQVIVGINEHMKKRERFFILGGQPMLKIRIMGTAYELKDYLDHMEKDRKYQILSRSEPLKNKGTKKYFRIFTDVEKKTRLAAQKQQERAGGEGECAE